MDKSIDNPELPKDEPLCLAARAYFKENNEKNL